MYCREEKKHFCGKNMKRIILFKALNHVSLASERSSMATCFPDDTMKGLSDLFGFELGVVRSFLIWKQNLILIHLCSAVIEKYSIASSIWRRAAPTSSVTH